MQVRFPLVVLPTNDPAHDACKWVNPPLCQSLPKLCAPYFQANKKLVSIVLANLCMFQYVQSFSTFLQFEEKAFAHWMYLEIGSASVE